MNIKVSLNRPLGWFSLYVTMIMPMTSTTTAMAKRMTTATKTTTRMTKKIGKKKEKIILYFL